MLCTSRMTDKSCTYESYAKMIICLIVPILLGYILYEHILSDQFRVIQEPLSYREACLSGKYSSLADLHQFITGRVESVQGEMSASQFMDEHVWKSRPVLMKGAANHWPILKEWTDANLQDNFNDVKFYVDMQKHHKTGNTVRRMMKLGKFVSNYKSKNWYLDSMTMDIGFLDEIPVPQYINVSGLFTADTDGYVEFLHNFYLSSGDTTSPLHYDGYNNLLTVLDGRKEWIIAEMSDSWKLQFDEWVDHPNLSPLNVTNFNVSDHPSLCDVTWHRATLDPGDTIYVPSGWPHHVYSPPSRNMAIGMWFGISAYSDIMDDAGYYNDVDDRNISGIVAIEQDHVSSRPRPCDVIECTPLPPGSLRTVLPRKRPEVYSRSSDTPLSKFVEMADGTLLRGIAYGTGTAEGSIPNPYQNTLHALNIGYRFVDTAQLYGNEAEIGQAIRDCKWKRAYVTVLTKILLEDVIIPGSEETISTVVSRAVDASLAALQLDYIDILIIHDTISWADNTDVLLGAWRALEAAVEEGKVKYIGLSNADLTSLKYIMEHKTVNVSLVQNVFTPLTYDISVLEHCQKNGIIFMGYGISGDIFDVTNPDFGVNRLLDSDILKDLSARYHASKHTILYHWAAQKGVVITARSTKLRHIRENMDYVDVMLSQYDVDTLDAMLVADDVV